MKLEVGDIVRLRSDPPGPEMVIGKINKYGDAECSFWLEEKTGPKDFTFGYHRTAYVPVTALEIARV